MKPYILLIVSVMVLVLSATACGAGSPSVTTSPTPPPLAGKQPVLQEIKNRGTLIVAVKKEKAGTGEHRDVAHFQKRDFEISIAKAIAKRLLGDENKIELKQLPDADRIPAVARGEVDLTISTRTITEDSKKVVNFSQPYAWEGLSLMVKKGSSIHGLEDLSGQTVGSNTEGGIFFGDELVKIAKERGLAVTAKFYDKFEEAASAVETGQLPAQVGRRINMLVYMTQKPGIFEIAGGPLTIQEYGIAVNKANPDLLAVANSVISDLKKSGEINRMAEKAGFPIAHVGPAPALAAPTPVPATTPTQTPTLSPVSGNGTGAGTGSGTGGGGGGGTGGGRGSP